MPMTPERVAERVELLIEAIRGAHRESSIVAVLPAFRATKREEP